MSEDTAVLSFKIRKNKSEEAEGLVKNFSSSSGIQCVGINFEKGKFNASFSSVEIDSDFFKSLEKLHFGLNKLGSKEVLTEIFFEQVGESDYYKVYENELKRFSSLKEMMEYEIELNSRIDVSKITFSKNTIEDTVISRFHCPVKNKRKKLITILENLLSQPFEKRQEYFSENIQVLLKSRKYQEVKWCAYRGVSPDEEEPPGPWYKGVPEIVDAIDFISEQGDYLFVGFDAKKVDFLQTCEEHRPHKNGFMWWNSFENRLSDMAQVLGFIDGVKEVTTKFRLANFPNDEYMTKTGKGFRSQNKSEDDNWVLPANYTDQDGKPI